MNVIGIALDELYRIFDILNAKYYESRLAIPVITIQRAKRAPKGFANLGWFTLDKVWKDKNFLEDDSRSRYEINISAEMLNYDVSKIVETLNHECVHYANKVAGIKDCNGQIHNKKFKLLAEKVGLICEQSKKYGFGITSCSKEFEDYISTEIKPKSECFEYFRSSVVVETPKKPREKKVFKHICPECGLVAKAKKDASIKCGACDVDMELDE